MSNVDKCVKSYEIKKRSDEMKLKTFLNRLDSRKIVS